MKATRGLNESEATLSAVRLGEAAEKSRAKILDEEVREQEAEEGDDRARHHGDT